MSDEANTTTPTWKIVSVVSFYMLVALIMVFVNKWVLSSSDLPLTFLLLQLSIAVVCLHVWAALPHTTWTAPKWTRRDIARMLPVSSINIVGLAFNIYCLRLVDASYFQVARGLTLPMTIALQSITTGARPSPQTIISCGLVTWGFTYSFLPSPFPDPVTGAIGTFNLSAEAPVLGMVLGIASAATIAVHAVIIKSALRHVDGSAMDLAYWTNALSAIAVVPAVVISGEVPRFGRLLAGEEGDLGAFAIGSAVTGVVGFLICLAGLLSIKVTSPVTHMFSSAVRSVLQTILGVQLFHDVLNSSRIISILLILIGSIVYTYYKSKSVLSQQSQVPSQQQAQQAIDEEEKATRSLVGTRPNEKPVSA